MARPKKKVEEKAAEIMEATAKLMPEAETEEQAAKIEHAVEALAEVIMEEEVQGDLYVGKHPVTGEAMYV